MKRIALLALLALIVLALPSCKKSLEDPPPPPAPTCNDGVMNGNETGVDCGGECPDCSVPEVSTNAVTSITQSTAMSGGNVLSSDAS